MLKFKGVVDTKTSEIEIYESHLKSDEYVLHVDDDSGVVKTILTKEELRELKLAVEQILGE